jgi:hypothetical protein
LMPAQPPRRAPHMRVTETAVRCQVGSSSKASWWS